MRAHHDLDALAERLEALYLHVVERHAPGQRFSCWPSWRVILGADAALDLKAAGGIAGATTLLRRRRLEGG
jgi:hypothetical protein